MHKSGRLRPKENHNKYAAKGKNRNFKTVYTIPAMKNNIVLHILLFLLLMLFFKFVGAQDYVVTSHGDSVAGEVKPLFYGPEKKVQLTGADDEKSTYTLFQVREFSHNGDTYHPVKGETGYVFMKLLQPGYLSLYAYQLEKQTRFDGLFLQKLDGDRMTVPNLGFKKYMSKFLEDCPTVVERIKSGEFGKKDLTGLIEAYNSCVEHRTIDHEKVIAGRQEQSSKISVWDDLEKKIREKDFSEKTNALDMIAEIRKKIQRGESIPNFLTEGLKNSLKETGLTADLDQALTELN